MTVVDDDVAVPGPGAEVVTADRWHRVFIVFVTVGIIVGAVLGIREIVTEPVIQLDDVRGSEEGVVPVKAQVLARNTSQDTTYCIEVTITATDRDGLTLATAVAQPTTGDGTLAPGRTANFTAELADLTQQEIDEELDSFYAFVTHQEVC
jgi:hypothetical protein